ncbi:hypothetical protein [Adhaeretor mobilis]|uniref:Uncharacterized protein n=1 Tax=Adhaeretor mobilis TaxID=1930276 RepID=A0A517MXB4_9BACT|nr:hypothetical protein [Adhaeretor mobilis]QDS99521.1 hypothetical protein HG15A2_28450 [Adhaeretor mobilis]
MNSLWITALAFTVGVNVQLAGNETQQRENEQRVLTETVYRFMAANADIQPDDLIVQSDVRDLQDFLRVTHHHMAFSSPLLVNRILADRSPLSRLYYRDGGDALRSVAEALGSYAPLDRLASRGSGRKALQVAIDSGSVVELLRTIESLESRPPPASSQTKIYTTRELVGELVTGDLPR